MRPFLGSFLRFASISLGLVSVAGCFPEHDSGRGNGDTGALEFSVQGNNTSESLAATGFQVEVEISRTDPQWTACVISKSVPNGSSQIQDCGRTNPEPISFIDASCDDDACTVTPEVNSSGEVALLVTGTHDGHTSLHVDVKSKTSSATWGDSFPITFITPTKIKVARDDVEAAPTGYALMPGAEFHWCPGLVDDSGNALSAIPSSITNTANGAAVTINQPDQYAQPSSCVGFETSTPGMSSFTFVAQSFTATESVVTADVSNVVAAELREILDSSDADAGAQPDAGSSFAATPTTSINLTTDDFFGSSYASVLTLKDGSHALGGAGLYVSSSKETVVLFTGDSDPPLAETSLQVGSAGSVIGDGTIDATIGSVKISIPFHVTAGDAGAN